MSKFMVVVIDMQQTWAYLFDDNYDAASICYAEMLKFDYSFAGIFMYVEDKGYLQIQAKGNNDTTKYIVEFMGTYMMNKQVRTYDDLPTAHREFEHLRKLSDLFYTELYAYEAGEGYMRIA